MKKVTFRKVSNSKYEILCNHLLIWYLENHFDKGPHDKEKYYKIIFNQFSWYPLNLVKPYEVNKFIKSFLSKNTKEFIDDILKPTVFWLKIDWFYHTYLNIFHSETDKNTYCKMVYWENYFWPDWEENCMFRNDESPERMELENENWENFYEYAGVYYEDWVQFFLPDDK